MLSTIHCQQNSTILEWYSTRGSLSYDLETEDLVASFSFEAIQRRVLETRK